MESKLLQTFIITLIANNDLLLIDGRPFSTPHNNIFVTNNGTEGDLYIPPYRSIFLTGNEQLYKSNHSRDGKALLKRPRRAYVSTCCGSISCNSDYILSERRQARYDIVGFNQRNNKLYVRKRNRRPKTTPAFAKTNNEGYTAVARIVNDGLSISCFGCPVGWQKELRLRDMVGSIPIVCPDCPTNWMEYLPNSDEEENETPPYDEYSEETSTTEESYPAITIDEFGNPIEIVTEIVEVDETDPDTTSENELTTVEESTTVEETSEIKKKTVTTTKKIVASIRTTTFSRKVASAAVSTTKKVTTSAKKPITKTPAIRATSRATTTTKSALNTLPGGMTIPPGLNLPGGMTLPKGLNLPAGMTMPQNLPGGITIPPGFKIPDKLPSNLGDLAALFG
ncbi:Hypothetical predicted protein [Cloeon dipterum]|uniref:Uncharacterized protein n=1 Tax=Cloeon dipterum TaxID=197152 RepID=A0A8S1CP56_9INSE|nr:Hypothetical predicted protein [Cloeon dipterum]